MSFFVFKTKLQIEFGILFISNGKGEMKMKKVLSLLTVFSLMLSIGVGFQNTSVKAASVPSISYQAHVQSIGWIDKNVYPFCIKYFNKRKDTNDIAILSQLILSTSIAFFIKLIIKKSISKLNAIGTITLLTAFPILQILML